jgi:prepilin-type N-terminal cleavage/methylation domain-containing protein
MNARCQKLFRTVKNRDGFTLIEMLIVIIILGILAMVIIPQITVSTEDAKVSTLKTNLSGIRGTIEVYYAQHNMTYPGVNAAGGTYGAANSADAFKNQLILFTDAAGAVSPTKTATHIYGPYIKGGSLPQNPYADNVVQIDTVNPTSITDRTPFTTLSGWTYRPAIGLIFANDGGTSNGVAHATY